MQTSRSEDVANQASARDGTISSRPPRTSHACERCRVMRTKCSGGERCEKCTRDGAVCEYGDGKREKNKKDLIEGRERLESLTKERSDLFQENAELLGLLRNITSMDGFPIDSFPEAVAMLAKTSAREAPSTTTAYARKPPEGRTSKVSTQNASSPERSLSAESLVESVATGKSGETIEIAGNVGSPGKQGELLKYVDLETGAGAVGLIGKASPISWLQRCHEQLLLTTPISRLGDVTGTTQMQLDQHDTAAYKANFYRDEMDLLSIDEDTVDSESLPPLPTSYLLAEACFHSLQGAFTFTYRAEFLETLKNFPIGRPLMSWEQRQWLASANIVFAIGAKWLQITDMNNVGIHLNHVEFYARARSLGLDHRVEFDHPVLEQVQSLGLLGFYLFLNGSIARAWTIVGHAMRHATALGLHLRVADPAISLLDRLRRARMWYSLYNLEILISEVTGRPKAITIDDMTVRVEDTALQMSGNDSRRSLPVANMAASESWVVWQDFLRTHRNPTIGLGDNLQTFQESIPQPLESRYIDQFSQRIKLCRISHRIGSALYSAVAGSQSWSSFQTKITSLNTALLAWEKGLPNSIRISPEDIQVGQSDPRPQIELGLYYQSVRMILHRPCVCRIEIPHESAQSRDFNGRSARACIRGAVSILQLMPDVEADRPHDVFQLIPWWAALHYVSQAASVLILELSLKCEHLNTEAFSEDQAQLMKSLKKAMHYLWLLAATSKSAAKAWSIFRHLYDRTMTMYQTA